MIMMKEKIINGLAELTVKIDDAELIVNGWDVASPTFLVNRMQNAIKEAANQIISSGAAVIIQEKKSSFPGYRKAITIWKKVEELVD